MVVGCEEGNCHFINGNLRARKRVERVASILEQAKIGSERVKMFNLGAGDGVIFVSYVNDFYEEIKQLGPSPICGGSSPSPQPEQAATMETAK
jgi:F420-non-reducing hydrogenase iron-sulfur subunit